MDELMDQLRDEFPHRRFIDCLGCGNSHSNEDNILHCMVHYKVVEEIDICKEFN